MKVLDRLEKKFGKYAIKNLTYLLIGGQVLAYILVYFRPAYTSLFFLKGDLVMQGQWWRLISFLFVPPAASVIFVVFAWYIFYIFGSALEHRWGEFRYLVYLLVAYVGTVILSFIVPSLVLTSGVIYVSVFLAFSYLYPDFRLYIFFIIPIKVRWLAYLAWGGIVVALLFGDISTKLLTIVSISNFILFFGQDIVRSSRLKPRTVSSHLPLKPEEKANHICAVCKKNEKTDPDMEIRYCQVCVPETCYCGEHIRNHEHKIVK